MWRDFKAFLIKENVLALAIAVVLGAALAKLVSALVADFIMPIVGLVAPAGNWRDWRIPLRGESAFLVGDFLGALIDFLIIGFVVWRISKAFMKPKPTAPTKPCPFCRQSIDAAATRCPHCTSALAA